MIKQVALKAKGTPCATGASPVRHRTVSNTPRGKKKFNGRISTTVENAEPTHRLGLEPRPQLPDPHILKGWKGEI